jgi:branched-chain amino acid transport system permease protein
MEFWVFVVTLAGIYTILGLGLQLQLGYCGLLNVGYVAAMGIAAYVMAICVISLGLPLAVAALVGVLAAVASGLGLGVIAARVRGDYFAMASLAFGEIVFYSELNAQGVTGGTLGSIAIGGTSKIGFYATGWNTMVASIQRFCSDVVGSTPAAWLVNAVLVWIVAALCTAALWFVTTRPWGRVARAVRHDEAVAESLGKRVPRVKIEALALGALLAGVAGLLYAFQLSVFEPSDFDPIQSLIPLLAIIVSGMGRALPVAVGGLIYGVIYAATRFLTFFPFSLVSIEGQPYVRLVIIGASFLALMIWRPQGLFGKLEELPD